MNPMQVVRGLLMAAAMVGLVSCGGGGGDSAGGPPAVGANQSPTAVVVSPSAGATFQAGDTVQFSGTATDPEDGPLAPSALTWWVELHHDSHSHPFQPETPGATGQVTLPTRGETSANIRYRFYLRATDSAGASSVVYRDLMPQTAPFTVTTQPAGLSLTLDGQPIVGPTTITGVVGMERDLGAAGVQELNGRRYQFNGWNDGQAAMHTIVTPSSSSSFVASYTDIGPALNAPPTVAITSPSSGATLTAGAAVSLTAVASDGDGSVAGVEFFANGVKVGVTDTVAPYNALWTPTTAGSVTLTARATDDEGAASASAAVAVTVAAAPGGTDTQPPVVTLTAPANLASGLAGTINLSATASDNVGVASVEFQLDGQAVDTAVTSAPYAATVDTSAYASGQHVVRARARDAAGNVSAWAVSTVEFGGERSRPAGFTLQENWVTGMNELTSFVQAPDGRFFVAEQGGRLRVVTAGGVLLATPFMTLNVDPTGERGLIGVALHPDFANNRYIYLHYTTPENGVHNRISRFTANPSNPNIVSVGSELRIADLPALSPAVNHNGGALHFGRDGKLYVAVGDNSDGAHAQDLNDPLGKMLRFNDDGSIPSDNPFCTTPGVLRCAIWARGLRNPFNFAVRASDGRIHINDVGSQTWEEINLGTAGANYGWPTTEGPTNEAGFTTPLFAYDHDPAPNGLGGFFNGCAITGGAFYPESGPFPAYYRGQYFFVDNCQKVIGRLDTANGNAAYAFGRVVDWPIGLLVGNDGALYVLKWGGAISRFTAP